MKTKMFLLICGVAVACLMFVAATNYGRRAAPRRTTWEYKISFDNPSEKVINDLGAEGWEIAGVGPDRVYFKRPK
jgi:hypothetical protein